MMISVPPTRGRQASTRRWPRSTSPMPEPGGIGEEQATDRCCPCEPRRRIRPPRRTLAGGDMDEQRKLILDQFTRQAVPFSEIHARDDAEVHRLLIDTAGIGPADDVLGVACG